MELIGEATAETGTTNAVPKEKVTPRRTRPKQRTGPKLGQRRVLSTDGAELLGVAGKLAEPFGAKEIAETAKCEWKRASNWILRARKSGWIAQVERGQYRRTGKFPWQSNVEAKPKQPKPSTEVGATVGPLKNGAGRATPTTLAGAMKLELSQLPTGKGISLEGMKTALAEKYPELYSAVGPTAVRGNLDYWARNGKLKKAGDGADPSFTVLDRAYFELAAAAA
jgi:hypothetical protein